MSARRVTIARVAACVVLVALTCARRAPAQEATRQACVDAAERGQDLMKSRRLIEAREAFAACTRDACPGLVRRDCTQWIVDVEGALPTIVLAARDAAGRDVTDAEVRIDGRVVSGALDGGAIPLDPGRHVIHVERASDAPAEETVVAREGEHLRKVPLQLAPRGARDHAADAAPSRVPWTALALAGVGLGAAVLSTYFGVSGLSVRSDRCSADHGCPPAAYDDVSRDYTISEIAAGAAVLSLAGAAWIFFTRSSAPPPPVGVAAGPRGAFAGARISF